LAFFAASAIAVEHAMTAAAIAIRVCREPSNSRCARARPQPWPNNSTWNRPYGPRNKSPEAREQIGDPPLRQMMRAIVGQVAALTKAAQVAQTVVARIMIQVRGGKHDARRPHPHHLLEVGPAIDTAASVAPCLPCRIEPSPVRQAAHGGAMGRPQPWQTPAARSKRTRRLSSRQWAGYRFRSSRLIGMGILGGQHGSAIAQEPHWLLHSIALPNLV
jgi:hypothetical protein